MLAISAAAGLCSIAASVVAFALDDVVPLKSPRVRRTSGPGDFQSSAKKDFFNTIGEKWSFEVTANALDDRF